MDVRRRNALAVYWSPCSLAYAMSVVVSLEMATDARKTPPVNQVNLQRSRIPTLIAVTSAFFAAISLLFAGAGGKDDGFDGSPERVTHFGHIPNDLPASARASGMSHAFDYRC
jgi:hypothetical protein